MNTHKSSAIAALAVMTLIVGVGLSGSRSASGQSPDNATKVKASERVIECYYKAKWGQADEFQRLFKKNHLPVLKKPKDEGRILQARLATLK